MKKIRFRLRGLSLSEVLMMGVLIAIQIILKRFTFGPDLIKVDPLFIVTFLMGKWYGAGWSAIGCGISDVLGTLMNGTMFIPGFTISAMASGWIDGLLIHRRPVSWSRVIVSQLLITVVINCLMNTVWLVMTYGISFRTAIIMRWPKELFVTPIQIVILYLIGNYRGIKQISNHYFQS